MGLSLAEDSLINQALLGGNPHLCTVLFLFLFIILHFLFYFMFCLCANLIVEPCSHASNTQENSKMLNTVRYDLVKF